LASDDDETQAGFTWQLAARAIALVACATAIGLVVGPWFRDISTFGFEDWDVETSHRELVRQALLRYHELPGWNPYACGGFPAWGYVEADTILVSPFLPLYLALPMALALRLEVLGMAVLGAVGAYLAASRFSKSEAARALVVALWAVDGRWALQTAAGHTWHLAYAFLPFCLWFFERARQRERRVVDLAGGAGCFAMLVYAGGIYPLPHTVLALFVYATCLAIGERSARPLTTLAAMGALGVGLAAPKLLPLLDGFGKAPRLIASTETTDLGALVTMLTSHDQGWGARPARVAPYGWHEWGLYIGVVGMVVLVLAVVFVRGKRETALKVTGLVFLVLGLGAFHPDAPWTLLHELAPVFRSQHVPSRFLYPAVLLLAIVAAAGIGRFVERRAVRRPWLDAALGLLVVAIAADVGFVAQKPMQAAMWLVPPDHIPEGRAFHFEQEPPFNYKKRHWAGPMYLAMLGNTGVINCYGAPPFDRKGAQPITSKTYHGEAWLDGEGTATIAAWSPNHVEIDVGGAKVGERLVYNMNFDEGWSSDAGPVEDFGAVVSTRLSSASGRVTFSYRPPYVRLGLFLFVVAAGAIALLRRREMRGEARP
jgi:hypothetical protein